MSIGKKLTEPFFTEKEVADLLNDIAPEIVLDDTTRGVTVPELAKLLRVPETTVRGWERRGELPTPVGRRSAGRGTGGPPHYLYDGCIVAPMKRRIKSKEQHEALWLRKHVQRDVQKRRALIWPPLWSALGKLLHKGSVNFRYRHCLTGRWAGKGVGMQLLIENTRKERRKQRNRLKHEEAQIERDAEARAERLERRAARKAQYRLDHPRPEKKARKKKAPKKAPVRRKKKA